MRAGDRDREVAVLVCAVVFVDTVFYAALAPLLPSLVTELHLSKPSAGLLTAALPLGTLAGSIPGGILAARRTPRFAVCAGLALLAVSCVAFGLLHTLSMLDAARCVQGLGGACSWAGGMTWLVNASGDGGRGTAVGTALGVAIVGALFGPAVGAIAAAVGRPIVFCSVAAASTILIFWARALPSSSVASVQGLREILTIARRRRVVAGMWLMLVPAVASGVLTVLAPLRLNDLGAGAGAIGATFLIAGALEAVITPAFGRLADRQGRLVPMRIGLCVATTLLLLLTLPGNALVYAAVLIATLASFGSFWAPATAMLSEAAEAAGLVRELGFGLVNLAWAAGLIIGAAGGGALAGIAGNGAALVAVAAVCGVTLAVLAAWRG